MTILKQPLQNSNRLLQEQPLFITLFSSLAQLPLKARITNHHTAPLENADSGADRSKIREKGTTRPAIMQCTKRYMRTLGSRNFTIRCPLAAFFSSLAQLPLKARITNRHTSPLENADSGADRSKIREEVPQCTKRYMRTLLSRNFTIRCPLAAFSAGRSERPEGATDTTGFLSRGVQNSTRARKFRVDAVHAGRSMIEMLGVLAIVGVLSVGGITGFSSMMEKHKTNQTIEQVDIITSKLSAIGSESASYHGLDNCAALKFNAVPDNMIVDKENCSLRHPYGSEVSIAPASLGKDSGDNQAFTVKFLNLPKKICVALASNDWGSGKNSSLIGIRVSSKTTFSATNSTKIYQGCNGGASNGVVTACNKGGNISVPMSPTQSLQGCNCTSNTCYFEILFY